MHRNAVRVLVPVLAVSIVAALGLAIWFSTAHSRGQARSGAGGSASQRTTPPTVGPVSSGVRTSTARGSHGGYDATVLVTRTDVGSKTLTLLDVQLSTEATPASAPTAEAQLTGADRVKHAVPLEIIGAGHWTSREFSIAAGRYTLTTRFDRSGGPVSIPMTIVLT